MSNNSVQIFLLFFTKLNSGFNWFKLIKITGVPTSTYRLPVFVTDRSGLQ